MQCEACRIAPVAVSNTDDDSYQPYQICDDCNVRLVGLALRPLEWFNLASTHGPNKHLLHDDFYDDDGTAFQAEIPFDDASSFPAPSLPEVAGKLPRLIDMATTQLLTLSTNMNRTSFLILLSRALKIPRTGGSNQPAFKFVRDALGKLLPNGLNHVTESLPIYSTHGLRLQPHVCR